jgi:hypothetical protein
MAAPDYAPIFSKTACISRGVHRWVHGLVHALHLDKFSHPQNLTRIGDRTIVKLGGATAVR